MIQIYAVSGSQEVPYVIRPCPLVSISKQANPNKLYHNLGSTFNITLNGTLIADEGSPFSKGGISPAYEPRPTGEFVPSGDRLGSILKKQVALQEIFGGKCPPRMEILPITGDEPVMIFYPKLVSMDFEEGIWYDTCRYTINLEADYLLDHNNNIIESGVSTRKPLTDYINGPYGLVEDFSETWSLESEDGNGITVDPFATDPANVVRTYRLTRNLSATGKNLSACGNSNSNGAAHIQAKKFIQQHIGKSLSDRSGGYIDTQNNISHLAYPAESGNSGSSLSNYFGSGFINIAQYIYGGYNHSFSENVDVSAGTYSVTETWLLSSGTAYENYSLSLSSSAEESNPTISINGTIKGLTSIPPSGSIFGGNASYGVISSNPRYTPYQNAIFHYNKITASGAFGLTSHVYKRAQNATNATINPTPASVSVGLNEFTGEITYDIQFNNKLTSQIPGAISEAISINDTYPGDVFASIPVIGRQTGPVLQYLGTRTEYRRDVAIDLVFSEIGGYETSTTTTPSPPGSTPANVTTTTTTLSPTQAIQLYRDKYLHTKPTLWEPARTQINNLVKALSPAYEFGIRKYFLNPPAETWNPKERRYTLNLSWTYELNH